MRRSAEGAVKIEGCLSAGLAPLQFHGAKETAAAGAKFCRGSTLPRILIA